MMPGATHIYLHAQSFQAPALTGGSFVLAHLCWRLEQDGCGADDGAREAVLVGLDEDRGAVAVVGAEL